MGGKTQQRVSGNAKPTSSGRIRELMINKQQNLGNIITFSTLANNPRPQKADEAKDKSIDEKQKAITTTNELKNKQNQIDSLEQKQMKLESNSMLEAKDTLTNNTNSPATTIEHKQKLVVRRVGNRDFFTRIKVPVDSTQLSETETYSATSSSDKTIYVKDKTDTNDSLSNQTETISKDNDKNDSNAEDNEGDAGQEQHEVFDFDTILSELNKIQDTCGKVTSKANSLNELSAEQIEKECELIRLLRILVRDFREDLSIEEWDLVVRSIYNWSKLITQTEKLLGDTDLTNFCTNVFKFVYQLISLAKQWKEVEDIEEKFPMMHLLLNDWNNFHSSNVYQDLIILYFKLISYDQSTSCQEGSTIIEALANIIVEVDPKLMLCNANLTKYSKDNFKVDFDTDFKLPLNHKFCIINTETKFKGFIPICNLLRSNNRVINVTAHGMLSKVMDLLSDSVSDKLFNNDEEFDDVSLLPPQPLMSILTSRDSMMCALLSDYKVGDISVTIEPNTDAYTCTLSYLFVWDLTIHFIVGINKEAGHKVIHSLKKLGFIQRLLDNIFMLLPPLGERDSLRFGLEDRTLDENQALSKNDLRDQSACVMKKLSSLDEFLRYPLKTKLLRPNNEIELTALHVYFSIALHMPVTVRKWYNNNSNKRLSNLVNEYTVKHISQIICTLEMETVHEKCQERANEDKSNNLIIKARPNAREVYAIYTRDEFKMELTIKLPINYPLGSVQIDGGKRVGVTDLKWRSWLLQLTTFLSHQNGPILDGIDLWRRNIDKRFEGIEKCMICFSILHSNYQLPKKKCVTCLKMFHNLCLYKWFESSGNSTCPLCRNIW